MLLLRTFDTVLACMVWRIVTMSAGREKDENHSVLVD